MTLLTAPEISVVVPVRNGAHLLPGLFESLAAQTLSPSRFEVVLVDDGSTDDTAAVARRWCDELPGRRRIVSAEARGPAPARNRGIREARGVWVATTDCDIRPEPWWLETALDTLERTGASALEGAIDELPSTAAGPYTTRQQNLVGGRYMTGNMVYRRELLEELGGFDESFSAQYLEDSDLAFRILDTGRDIVFAPDVVVRHPVEERSVWSVFASIERTRWFVLFAKKHPIRYRRDLRPMLRPLNAVDVDVLIAFVAAAAAVVGGGLLARVVLVLVALNGLKRGLGAAGLPGAPLREWPARTAVAVFVPPLRLVWLVVGWIRFRKVVW